MTHSNRVVVRYRDGRILKGVTRDFVPNKESFHVADHDNERNITEVITSELKAVFFVRTFGGDPRHEPTAVQEELLKAPGRKLKVTFFDGEVIYGTTNAYTPGRGGFFLIPADRGGNNERAYVYAAATSAIDFVRPAPVASPAVPHR